MLKKLLLALICLPVAFAGFSAQLTATLQSGDKVTPFYGASSFVDAYNAAIDGDVITLSPGLFTDTEIQKSITVIGTYAFSTDDSKTTRFSSLTVSADNVTLEGLRFTGTLLIKGADQLTISRCYIPILSEAEKTDHKYHDNTIITDCLVDKFNAMALSKNAVLRNCCINYFSNTNKSANIALIENCNIPLFAFCDNTTYNIYSTPYAIYRNCFLGLYSGNYYDNKINGSREPSVSFSAPTEFHGNCFKPTYYLAITNGYCKKWNITYGSCVTEDNVTEFSSSEVKDKTKVGQYSNVLPYNYYSKKSYGPVDHKSYPAIPSITSSEIDTKTDAEGNLHVKISATARD